MRWTGPWLAVVAGLAAGPAAADEPMFGQVNTTDLLPRSKAQVEQWATWRDGRAVLRSEADYGVRDDLQVSAYLNATRARFEGVTAEAIWRLTSPYLSPLGTALLADATVSRHGRAVGVKAIAQKNFRDDTVILAANLRAEITEDAAGSARRVEASLGASYRFRANWSLALEARAREGGRLVAGPTVHYGGRRCFLTASALGAHEARLRAGRTF